MRASLITLLGLMALAPTVYAAPELDKLTLPAGFHIAIYSDKVPDAREITVGGHGTVFVGSSDAGKVYALTDSDGSGKADKVRVVASGLTQPIGIAFKGGDLYISAISRIVVLRDIESHLDDPPKPEVVTDKLTRDTQHGGKYLAFGPDGKLYVPIGAPCNVCDEKGYAKLTRMNADGSGVEDVALGLRNTVGFTWNHDGTLWLTDNGRDMMGDDLPSDELNHVTKPGQHFGFPYCHQGDTLDPEFGKGKNCADYTPPALKLGAHVAALGLRFYEGKAFPSDYRQVLFIAEHGSWNRSTKSGYRVMSVDIQGDRVSDYKVFIDGFQQGEQAWGRPVDVQPLADGSLLVSDELAGAVYRVTYTKPPSAPKTDAPKTGKKAGK